MPNNVLQAIAAQQIEQVVHPRDCPDCAKKAWIILLHPCRQSLGYFPCKICMSRGLWNDWVGPLMMATLVLTCRLPIIPATKSLHVLEYKCIHIFQLINVLSNRWFSPSILSYTTSAFTSVRVSTTSSDWSIPIIISASYARYKLACMFLPP